MKKSFFLSASFVVLASLLACLTSCGEDKEVQNASIEMAVITYTYKVSPEMLDYFNITASYTDPEENRIGVEMHEDSIVIRTSTQEFPSERSLEFSVTRKNTQAPETAPQWQTSIRIVVDRYYTDGTNNTTMSEMATNYSPRPDKFDIWCNQYITRMATGYPTYIRANGVVIFSTE